MRYTVKATPNSQKISVVKEGEVLKVKIDAPPVNGRANKRLIEILSEYFNVPLRDIRIVSGFTSRNKIVEIIGG